jgi:lipoprotein NlpI
MNSLLSLLSVLLVLLTATAAGAQSADDLVKQTAAALKAGKIEDAIALAGKALKAEPNNVQALFLRGSAYQLQRKYDKAVGDFSKVIELSPEFADAYQRRGMEQYKLGRIDASIKDFDHYLKLRPKAKPEHWQRGISYYYAGRYKEGQEQFEGYQNFESNDVENAVWRYLCMVPLVGTKKARAALFKIDKDERVPMRQVYDLFAGKLTPKDVLAAAKAGKPSPQELNQRLFYAHLYLGLYYESEGNPKKALEHLNIATEEHPIGHYMWDVARVHRDILRKKEKK